MKSVVARFVKLVGGDDCEELMPYCDENGELQCPYGYLVTIRGKKYRFPSLTHMFEASRSSIARYKI